MAIVHCQNPATWHPTIHRNESHHHPPKSWTTNNGATSKILELCGICHSEYHALLNEYVRAKGLPTWEIRRTYSPFLRPLVQECWDNRTIGKTPYTTVLGADGA
jgi:hypothetical protein